MTIDIDSTLLAEALALGSATLHEAGGKIGALPARLRPLSLGTSVAGRAFPVSVPGGDNLWLHEAIVQAAPGDVIIAKTDVLEHGYFGEVMAVACQARGIAGLVIDGGVRDVAAILELGFPVFSAAISIRGTGKNPALSGRVGTSVKIDGVTVNPGDLVVGDPDGVVIVPVADAETVIKNGRVRTDEEQDFFRRLRAGETTFDIYGFPRV